MKLSLKPINQKRKPELNIKLNASRVQNPKKIISSKKNSTENSKTFTNSNSQIYLKNPNKSQIPYINTKKIMGIDDIDETNYNPSLYIIPEKRKDKKKYYTSNIEKAVETYNEIKKEINQKIFNKKISSNYISIQKQNFALVTLLEKLNLILDTIVERSRYTNNKKKGNPMSESQEILKNKNNENKNKKKITEKEINNNMLKSYIQEYNLLSSKYEKLTNGNYAINLRTNIVRSSDEATKLEKENRELKRTQSRTELILKNLKISKGEKNYKIKLEEYDKLSNEYESTNKYILVKESEFLANERRIQKLEQDKKNLIKTAKEEFKIENPEELNIIKKDESKDAEKLKLYIKRKEIENKVMLINNTVKKYGIIEKDNQKFIKDLEENISNRIYALKLKKEEIVKLSEILEKLDIENNNYIFQTELKKNSLGQDNINENNNLNKINKRNKRYEINNNNNNNIQENEEIKYEKENKNDKENKDNKEIKVIKDDKGRIQNEIETEVIEFNKNLNQENTNLSNPEIHLKEINNAYSIKKEKNTSLNNLQTAKTYNKKMILQQLDDQKKREQETFNRIKLHKKNLKPNFSFSLNNSSKKENTIEKNEKNVNLSVAVMSNRNKDLEEKSETEEIKEDINITPYDDNKIRPEEEEQRILTNMSQNLDLIKDNKKDTEKEENIEDENINSKNKIKKKITIENSEEKNRQNALNTLPFYELEESDKNIKTEKDNENIIEGDNKDNKEEKKEDEKFDEDKKEKEEENIKDEKKEEEMLNEENKEEEKINEEYKEEEILNEENKEEEKINDEYKEEEKINYEYKDEEILNKEKKEEEILNEENIEEEILNKENKDEEIFNKENKGEKNIKDLENKEEEKINEEYKELEKVDEENKKENENGGNKEQNEDNYFEDEIEGYYQDEMIDIENLEEN